MQQNEFEDLKNNPQFMLDLTNREEAAVKAKDIVGMYEILDTAVMLDLSAERLNRIYTEILQTVFDRLADKLTKEEFFDINNKDDLYTMRGIYEHGIERYSDNDFKGAKEIFLILHHTANDEVLSKAMMPHIAAAASQMKFDDFIDEFVDVDNPNNSETYGFFLTNFKPSIEGFMKEKAEVLNNALKELETLKKG
ncbi:hypothetical protein [Hydrogenimonas thermophila]|uniref:Uncharacterized protein n=1 Tax=Hydrogenimonas thermophila TaxID=223786 RepID=A0A1I5T1I2_9BACT|nr:hypothetical protein [Hydrogenimonas thermophila]WOE70666.1 hypothetical protein RZR91_03625 [Hydrogenimonas thermophila]WOE73184.1 hypothetical protein RZR97_03615 [Hydrogenimonas thermophila]SFP76892.1 hypothetical protein SAMN05216234_13919 [Hydrogenimonas thermophila]